MRNDNKMLLSAPTNGSIHLDTHTFWFKNMYKDKFAREQWRYLYLLFLSNKKSACGIFIDLDFIQEFRMRYTSTYYVMMKQGLWEIKAGARHSHSLNFHSFRMEIWRVHLLTRHRLRRISVSILVRFFASLYDFGQVSSSLGASVFTS